MLARCVVVDDDVDWIDLVRYALANSQPALAIIGFLEAEAALAYLRQHSAELVISDVRMPRVDGPAFIQEFRRFDAATPVILMSSDPLTAEDAASAGANRFVRKGALKTTLARTVESLLPGLGPQSHHRATQAGIEHRD